MSGLEANKINSHGASLIDIWEQKVAGFCV